MGQTNQVQTNLVFYEPRIERLSFNQLQSKEEFNEDLFKIDYHNEVRILKPRTTSCFFVEYENEKRILKTFKLKDIESIETYRIYQKEVETLMSIDHPNFVKAIGGFRRGGNVGYITKYSTDLKKMSKYLHWYRLVKWDYKNEKVWPRRITFSILQKLKILLQVLDVVLLLSERNLIHDFGDRLGWEFFRLYDKDKPLIKLTSLFGIKRKMKEKWKRRKWKKSNGRDFCSYWPPELWHHGPKQFDENTLVFSFGIMMYELMTENHPYYYNIMSQKDKKEKYQKIVQEVKYLKRKPSFSIENHPIFLNEYLSETFGMFDLMKKMFDTRPEERPRFIEIKDIFVTQIQLLEGRPEWVVETDMSMIDYRCQRMLNRIRKHKNKRKKGSEGNFLK